MPDLIDFPRASRDVLVDYKKDVKGCHNPVRIRTWDQDGGPKIAMLTLPHDRIAAAVIVSDIRRRYELPDDTVLIEHRQPTKDKPEHSFWTITGTGAQMEYTRIAQDQTRAMIDPATEECLEHAH